MTVPRLIGMVHLQPLPGSPRFSGDLDSVLKRAVSDAGTLRDAGFDAALFENFGDAPFFPRRVPSVTIASMTRAISEASAAFDGPFGVNVLRNDGLGAAAIAAATGARFIRVNVLAGAMFTDQGLIEGEAAGVTRAIRTLAPGTALAADVMVKHATPPAGSTLEQMARDIHHRSGADALIVSGTRTGTPTSQEDIETVRSAVPSAHLVVGSGATTATVRHLLELADSVIVGSALKRGPDPANKVDPTLARSFVDAAAAG